MCFSKNCTCSGDGFASAAAPLPVRKHANSGKRNVRMMAKEGNRPAGQ
jgi:hypothetical protein